MDTTERPLGGAQKPLGQKAPPPKPQAPKPPVERQEPPQPQTRGDGQGDEGIDRLADALMSAPMPRAELSDRIAFEAMALVEPFMEVLKAFEDGEIEAGELRPVLAEAERRADPLREPLVHLTALTVRVHGGGRRGRTVHLAITTRRDGRSRGMKPTCAATVL